MIKLIKCQNILILAIFVSNINSQSIQDLQKMKSEYEKFDRNNSELDQLSNNRMDNNQIQIQSNLPNKANLIPLGLNEMSDSTNQKLKHFGYNYLMPKDTISFWENLPTPSNYLLGPGDEIIITLWGETQFRQTFIISRDGKIYDNKVGLLNVTGKSIGDAKKYLLTQFSRIYSTLKGKNPSTYIDISLGQLRSININFVGEVLNPGVYPVHPFSTVITGLIQAGGVDTTGSLRNIKIIRNNDQSINVDLYDYFIKGSLPNNIQLRDQDVVFIPVKKSKITVDSSVVRPGYYESKQGETIMDLIDYSGGLTEKASNVIGVSRILSFEKRKLSKKSNENFYIDYEMSNNITVANGDIISVQKIFHSTNEVEIIGQVKRPDIYYFYPGMKLKDLISLGGGFTDSTFLKSVYKGRAELVRKNPLSRFEEVIEIDLSNVINGGDEGNISLQNLDRFVVHANLNFFEKDNIQILGEVNIPGMYPVTLENESLSSFLNRAGGLTTKALNDGIEIYRDSEYFNDINEFIKPNYEDNLTELEPSVKKEEPSRIRVAWKNKNISLMPGDSVVVKEDTRTIKISGEVYNPGLVEFRKGKSLRYYINSVGGITNRGSKNDIIVVYANGLVSPKKWFLAPKVKNGSTIIINKKPIAEPFDLTQFATNWTSIIASVITTIILSKQV